MSKPLGSFTCPNLIKSATNNVVLENLTTELFSSKNIDLILNTDNTFICKITDDKTKIKLTITGKYDSNELTLYNELLPEEITGETTLINFALITSDGKTMNCCTLCSNTCYGSNPTLAPTKMNMKSVLSLDDEKLYIDVMQSDDKLTTCSFNTILPLQWPKKENYKNIEEYLIDCCKCSLYFRNSCLTSAMSHCISLNQRLSSLYCGP